MENDLPKEWLLIKVSDVSEIIRGITYQKSDASSSKFENSCLVLRGGNIQDGKIVIDDDLVYVHNSLIKEEQKLRLGDVIIVGSTGSQKLIGKAAFSLSDENEISFGAFLALMRPSKLMESRFFDYFFLTDFYRNEIRELAGGININNIRREHLEGLDFPLPPLPEQQRIVAKLDTLFGQLDRIKASMERIPQLLKDFRQKLLTQAVTGKLTEEWREVRELEEWTTETLGSALEDVKYGTSKKSDYETLGTPILRIPNIQNGEIDISDLKFSVLDNNEFNSLKLIEGDILIIRSNGSISLVGQSAIVRKDLEGYSYAGYLIRLRVNNLLSPDYLNYALKSYSLREQIVEKARSTSGVNNINSQEIKDLIVSYPPLEEQQEIVRRVESLFAKADRIEASYQKLQAKLEQLPQALLAKAFRGELVEQLPTDGDARDLLEQIRKLKEEGTGKTQGSGAGKGRGKKLVAEDEVRMVAEDGAKYGK